AIGVAEGDGVQLAVHQFERAGNGELVGNRDLARDTEIEGVAVGGVIDGEGGTDHRANLETAGDVQPLRNAEGAGLGVDEQGRAVGNGGGKRELAGQGDRDAAGQCELVVG